MVREAYSPIGHNAIQAELATDLVERSGSRDRDATVSLLKMSDAGDAWSIADNPRKEGDTAGGTFTLPAKGSVR